MSTLYSAAIVGIAVFAACLFGIYTRPIGFLASVWPANAILLGLMLRLPGAATLLGWTAGTIAFLAADLVTGNALFKTVLLTAGNLAGIGAAFFVYSRLSQDIRRMRHPAAALFLILASALGGAASGIVGAFANPILFGGTALAGFTFWFATETANYLALLPVLLTAPSRDELRQLPALIRWSPGLADIAPALALLLACLAGMWIGGPGALVFPVPALLWCGLAYSLFGTALMTFAFSIWALVAISGGYVPGAGLSGEAHDLASLRIGVYLVALAPLTVSSAIAMRNDLLRDIQHQAAHDYLTGLPNRRGFRTLAELAMSGRDRAPAALIMIDIDHFKRINDRFGHDAGDEVLRLFAQRLGSCLHPPEIVARLGGEEFVVLLPAASREQALGRCENMRASLAAEPIVLRDGDAIQVTASFGISLSANGQPALGELMTAADKALYQAKAAGRNGAVVYDAAFPAPPVAPSTSRTAAETRAITATFISHRNLKPIDS